MMRTSIDVDEKLWKRFKRWSLDNDTSMKDKIDELIRNFLEG